MKVNVSRKLNKTCDYTNDIQYLSISISIYSKHFAIIFKAIVNLRVYIFVVFNPLITFDGYEMFSLKV